MACFLYLKVIDSAWTPSNSTMLYPGLQVDFAEVRCLLPESPVNLGDYDNAGVSAAGLSIAISNNRINVSENSMLFITYDSVCQECNTSTGCQFKVSVRLFFYGHPHDIFICVLLISELFKNSLLKR